MLYKIPYHIIAASAIFNKGLSVQRLRKILGKPSTNDGTINTVALRLITLFAVLRNFSCCYNTKF